MTRREGVAPQAGLIGSLEDRFAAAVGNEAVAEGEGVEAGPLGEFVNRAFDSEGIDGGADRAPVADRDADLVAQVVDADVRHVVEEVRRRLDALKKAAAQEPQVKADGAIADANTMPYIIDAVRAYATVGEICEALKQVYGTYEEASIT